ncbi:MAG: twin-arginine translocase subunit TatC [Chloroflexi bacterium]|nr:twin-arginine translocase subunit TatC [Chloroflexota bacterium]
MSEIADERGGPSRAVTADAILPPDGMTRPPLAPAGDTPPSGPSGEEKVMSLVDHLAELRRRVAISIMAIVLGSAVGFWFAPAIIELLLRPVPGGKVVFLSLTGGFAIHLRIAFVVGLVLALPVVLYQLWAFVAPGLTARERRAALPWIPMTPVFFALGAAVAYATLPYAVEFLLSFQIADTLESLLTAEHYFGFVTTLFLVFGVTMQFPILLILLAKLGILSVDRLRATRRYVLLGIVIFAVVVTPGTDPISPVIMSSVMYLLYEGTILILRRSGQGRTGAHRGNDV